MCWLWSAFLVSAHPSFTLFTRQEQARHRTWIVTAYHKNWGLNKYFCIQESHPIPFVLKLPPDGVVRPWNHRCIPAKRRQRNTPDLAIMMLKFLRTTRNDILIAKSSQTKTQERCDLRGTINSLLIKSWHTSNELHTSMSSWSINIFLCPILWFRVAVVVSGAATFSPMTQLMNGHCNKSGQRSR